MIRLFCVTVYVFNKEGNECLFINHRKLQKWLPPGGKIDPNEIPDTAAIRECFEETGVKVRLIGELAPVDGGLQRPYGVQVNTIVPHEREHIDFIYLAVPEDDGSPLLNEREATGIQWFPIETILDADFNTFASIKTWVKKLSGTISQKKM